MKKRRGKLKGILKEDLSGEEQEAKERKKTGGGDRYENDKEWE